MMFHEEGGVVCVAASKAGEPSNPAWFHNLRATLNTTIRIGSEVRKVRARVAAELARGEASTRIADRREPIPQR
jgi:hypothetical protein